MGRQLKLGAAYTLILKRNYSKANEESVNAAVLPTGILPIVLGLAMNLEPLILGILLTAGCMGDIALYQKFQSFQMMR